MYVLRLWAKCRVVYVHVCTFEVWSALYPGLMQPVKDLIDALLDRQDVDLLVISRQYLLRIAETEIKHASSVS
jgi:hypothetical protein